MILHNTRSSQVTQMIDSHGISPLEGIRRRQLDVANDWALSTTLEVVIKEGNELARCFRPQPGTSIYMATGSDQLGFSGISLMESPSLTRRRVTCCFPGALPAAKPNVCPKLCLGAGRAVCQVFLVSGATVIPDTSFQQVTEQNLADLRRFSAGWALEESSTVYL